MLLFSYQYIYTADGARSEAKGVCQAISLVVRTIYMPAESIVEIADVFLGRFNALRTIYIAKLTTCLGPLYNNTLRISQLL